MTHNGMDVSRCHAHISAQNRKDWHKTALAPPDRLNQRVAIAALAANPDTTNELLALLPDGPMRTLASAGLGLFVFSLAAGSRLMKQGPKP